MISDRRALWQKRNHVEIGISIIDPCQAKLIPAAKTFDLLPPQVKGIGCFPPPEGDDHEAGFEQRLLEGQTGFLYCSTCLSTSFAESLLSRLQASASS